MRVGSVFSGVGGFEQGLEAAGMTTAWQCEIDAAARGVLHYHWPDLPQYHDIRGLHAGDLAQVDVLCGGFPCQDVSIAGKRAGLRGQRSGLVYEFLRLAEELRPRWLLLENVSGLLSSNRGRDMGAVLWALGQLGYGWAYRVLDAQWFGVPQRRRRVFIVGYLGNCRRPGKVLFEHQSLRRDSAPRRKAGEAIAGSVGVCAGGGSRGKHVFGWGQQAAPVAFGGNNTSGPIDVATACRAKGGSGHGDFESETFVLGPHLARRLTPRECERLMGWPDDWTRYKINTKGAAVEQADGPRYKQCGNGVVKPVAAWIGRRMMHFDW